MVIVCLLSILLIISTHICVIFKYNCYVFIINNFLKTFTIVLCWREIVVKFIRKSLSHRSIYGILGCLILMLPLSPLSLWILGNCSLPVILDLSFIMLYRFKRYIPISDVFEVKTLLIFLCLTQYFVNVSVTVVLVTGFNLTM